VLDNIVISRGAEGKWNFVPNRKTFNAQHSTSNIQWDEVRKRFCKLDVGRWMLNVGYCFVIEIFDYEHEEEDEDD
jgi:hypothetical protein